MAASGRPSPRPLAGAVHAPCMGPVSGVSVLDVGGFMEGGVSMRDPFFPPGVFPLGLGPTWGKFRVRGGCRDAGVCREAPWRFASAAMGPAAESVGCPPLWGHLGQGLAWLIPTPLSLTAGLLGRAKPGIPPSPEACGPLSCYSGGAWAITWFGAWVRAECAHGVRKKNGASRNSPT